MQAPEWVTPAIAQANALRFLFHNFFGETWIAEVDADGNVEVSGLDVGWERIALPAPKVKNELEIHLAGFADGQSRTAPLARGAPLAGQWIVSESERIWWISVLMVAHQAARRLEVTERGAPNAAV